MRSRHLIFLVILCTLVQVRIGDAAQEFSSTSEGQIQPTHIQELREDELAHLIQSRPIDQVMMEEIAQQFTMEEEERKDWKTVSDNYRMEWKDAAAKASARANQLRLAAYDWNAESQTFHARPVPELVELYENSIIVNRALREIDTQLFENLALLIESEQISKAKSIAFQRKLERESRPTHITAAKINLTQLVYELNLDAETLENLDSVLESYRRSFGEAATTYAEIFDEDTLASAYEVDQLGPLPRYSTTSALITQIDDDRQDRALSLLEAATEMRILNQEFLKRFRSALPDDKAAELLRAWRSALGASYLAEQAMLRDLATEIAADPTIGKSESAAILLAIQEVSEENSSLDERILEQTDLVDSLELEPSNADRDAELLAMSARLLKTQAQRRARLRLTIGTMIGILGSDLPTATERLVALDEVFESRSESDISLARRSERRSGEIRARLAWEEEERLVRESLAEKERMQEQESQFEETPQ